VIGLVISILFVGGRIGRSREPAVEQAGA